MKIHHQKKKNSFITTYIIAGGFFLVIILGTLFLKLPISVAKGQSVGWTDALFTATTSVCVTGLVTVPTYSTWSFFGQLVILILIQIGGLGVISFTILFMQFLGKKIGLREQQLIRDAYNLDTTKGLSVLVRKIVKGTMIVEGTGAFLYSCVFIPEFGLSGIWKSIFISVSAFCNAGMDVISDASLIPYQTDIWINVVTMALIILGGIGFPIWFLTIDALKKIKKERVGVKDIIKSMSLYVKTVLFMTVFLIVAGTILIFGMEYSNVATIGNLSFGEKILASLFQSVTTRTAGFCSIPQEGLRRCTIIVCCILMLIGGSPSGTAGGIKTTTFAIILASLISAVSERNDTELFHRKINPDAVRKAVSVFSLSFSVMLIALTVFCMVQPGTFEDCLYEVVSAIGTVGLSRNLTSGLTFWGKLVIIFAMYLGRIGPISLALFFNNKKYMNLVQYPEGKIPIG